MLAFEVYVNKVKVCTAGLGDLQGLFASLSCTVNPDGRPDERNIYFSVNGIGDHKVYNWVRYKMQVRNRIEIRIVDASKADTPKELGCPGGSCATGE